MRRILLTTSIALALVFLAVLIINNITEAQRPERPDRPDRRAQRQRPRGERPRSTGLATLMGGIRESFFQVAIMMDTNDEQLVEIRAAYKEILKDVKAKREVFQEKEKELREKMRDLQGDERRQQMREFSQQARKFISGINSNLKDKLKVTLTGEQFEAYEKWDKKRQERPRRQSQGRRERPRQRETNRPEPKPEKEVEQ